MSARQGRLSLFKARNPPLRPYQQDFVQKVNEAWGVPYKNVLAVLPTGSGKSLCAGKIIAEHTIQNKRTLFLAHTRKLVQQFQQVTEDDYGIHGEIEMGEKKAHPSANLVCATIQTMVNRVGARIYPEDHFNLVLIDECHRSLGQSFQDVCEYFSEAKVLGITATPRRGDLRDLMKFFDHKAIDIPLSQLIQEGYLSQLIIKNIPVAITLKKDIEGAKGDYSEEEIGHAIEPYLASCADQLTDELGDRCGLVFLPLIDLSKKFTHLLIERGIRAAHVDGEMKDRDLTTRINDLKRGDLQVLCSSMILSEGIDIPPVSVLMNLRPTRSWTLYVQIAGRATRVFGEEERRKIPHCRWPIKTNSVLLDPLWLCDDHSLLQRPSCLVATHEEDIEEINEQIKAGGPVDLLAAAGQASFNRGERLRERLEAMAKRKARLVNAMDFFLKSGNIAMADYEPQSRWGLEEITQGQRNVFLKHEIDISSIKNKGQATKLLDMIIDRSRRGLATIRMAKFGEAMGLTNAWTKSFEDVREFLDRHSTIPD